MLTACVIVAAGRGHRLGGETPKQYIALEGGCPLRRCVHLFLGMARIGALQVVIHPDDMPLYAEALRGLRDPRLLPPASGGGDARGLGAEGARGACCPAARPGAGP